jgi:hypothetical protein
MSSFLILLLLMSITNCEYNGNNRRIPPIHHGPPNVHINRPIQHGPIYHGPPNVHIHRPIHHRPPINRHGYCNSDSAFKICCNGILQNKYLIFLLYFLLFFNKYIWIFDEKWLEQKNEHLLERNSFDILRFVQ